jgi:hypothetical protein
VLWTAALAACWAGLGRMDDTPGRAGPWIPLALGAAALVAWRDSPTLKALAIGTLLVLLGLAMMRARGGSPRRSGLARQAVGLALSAGEAALGAGRLVARDIRWSELRGDGRARLAASVLRGAALSLPLLLVFGTLLVAADAAFERMMGRVFAVEAHVLAGHVLLAAVVAWIAGGILRTLAFGAERPDPEPVRPAGLSVGIVEAGVALALLNLLFLAFVLVQLPYLFGSAAALREPGAASFAEYARRGFFELVAVAGMVLPLLLLADWTVRRERPAHERAFRAVAGATVALLFVIMASALHRMRLYQGAYGLTELRLYTTAFMLWLGLVLALFAATVLRGRGDRFAFGALVSALGAVVVLHAVNPDAWIVRVNASRARTGVRFDAPYAASLGADAVPALVAALEEAGDGAGRCAAARTLLRRWGHAGDWRSWSLARARAVGAVQARRAELAEMVCEPRGVARPRR